MQWKKKTWCARNREGVTSDMRDAVPEDLAYRKKTSYMGSKRGGSQGEKA